VLLSHWSGCLQVLKSLEHNLLPVLVLAVGKQGQLAWQSKEASTLTST